MRFRNLSLALVVVELCVIGCKDGAVTAAVDDSQAHSIALSSAQAAATGVVRGVVIGEPFSVPTPDSAGSVQAQEHVADAKVEVYRELRDSSATGGAVSVSRSLVGVVTTDAAGRFELTNVPEKAYFRLDVTPPASSPYQFGSSGSVSFPAGAVSSAIVYLYHR